MASPEDWYPSYSLKHLPLKLDGFWHKQWARERDSAWAGGCPGKALHLAYSHLIALVQLRHVVAHTAHRGPEVHLRETHNFSDTVDLQMPLIVVMVSTALERHEKLVDSTDRGGEDARDLVERRSPVQNDIAEGDGVDKSTEFTWVRSKEMHSCVTFTIQ